MFEEAMPAGETKPEETPPTAAPKQHPKKKKKKKDKYANTPKWAKQGNKKARHDVRIRMARQWFSTYKGTGDHIVHAYRQKFKVDVMTALNDLSEIGALTPEQASMKRQAEEKRIEHLWLEKGERKLQDFYDRFPDSDDQFFYIAGYTSGGAPYGVTWEQMGLLPYQDPENAVWESEDDDLSEFKDELRLMGRNSIRLDIAGESPCTVGCTKFGGVPDVPDGFTWPVFETGTYEDEQVKPRPLAFLAQFNCAELKKLDKNRLLPPAGLLSFFYELESQRWGFDPKDKGCAKVFWFPDIENLSPAVFPENLGRDFRLPAINITMCREKSFPDYEDFTCQMEFDERQRDLPYEYFASLQCELEIDPEVDNCSKLLGWPNTIQGSMAGECELVSKGYYLGGSRDQPPPEAVKEARRTARDEWQLLFQLDTVQADEFELMFGDCGRIYFFIRKSDLKAKCFDNVWLILQCF